MSLKSKVILQCVLTFVAAFVLLFLPAGTLHFWEAWVYLAIVFIPTAIFSAYYYKHDPAFVQRRMEIREKVTAQKWFMRAGNVSVIGGLVIPGLDHRFHWTRHFFGLVPLWVEILAQVLMLCGYLLSTWVMDVNRFAARSVRVEEGQRVITTGPYRIVRHPLYACALLFCFSSAPALGSYVALPFFALVIPILVARLLNEEKLLRQELPGYSEYCQGTRYHLIPYIW
jgi:protein-S-isoprenylcysteine O-methyltransferase Ste14